MMDLSQIVSVYLGSTEIGEIYKGSNKIWPSGDDGPEFIEELHEALVSWYWDEEEIKVNDEIEQPGVIAAYQYSSFNVLLNSDAKSLDKVYFEVYNTFQSEWGLALYVHYYDSTDPEERYTAFYVAVSGYASADNDAGYVIESSNATEGEPGVGLFCIDLVNKLIWCSFMTTDQIGIATPVWNDDNTADPVTGIGGFDISTNNMEYESYGLGIVIEIAKLEGESSIECHVNLHEHQFLVNPPSGYKELIVDGEYA